MNKRLEEINKLVSEHVGKDTRVDEKLFKFGVELGRELQKLDIDDYRLPFFENQAQSLNVEKVKRQHIKKLNEAITNQAIKALKAHLDECGTLTFNASYNRSKYEKLDDSIGERYGVMNTRTSQTNVGGDFEIHFAFVGKMLKYFTDNKVSPLFEMTLYNSHGESTESVYEIEEDNSPFGSAICGLNAHNSNQSVEFVKNFCEGFEKQLLMHYLSVK